MWFLLFSILPIGIFGYVGEENWIAIFNGHPYHPHQRRDAHTVDHPFYPARFDEHPKHFSSYLNDAFLAYWLQHNPHYEVFGQTFENEQKEICAKFPAQNGYDQMIKCSGFRVLINTRPVYDRSDSDFFFRTLLSGETNQPQQAPHRPRIIPQDTKTDALKESVQAGRDTRPPETVIQQSMPGSKNGHWFVDEAGKWKWHEGHDGRLGHWYHDDHGWHWHSAYGQEYTIPTKRRRRNRHAPRANTLYRLPRQIGRGAQYGDEVEFLNQKAVIIVDPQRQHSFFGTARPVYKGSSELEAVGVNYDGRVIVVPLSGQNAYQGYQVFQIARGRPT